MHEFITSMTIEGVKYQTRYAVLSFHSESEFDWLFEVIKTDERMVGYDWTPIEKSIRTYHAFSKKRQVNERWVDDSYGKRKIPVYEMNEPPQFYDELRNHAIDEGKWHLPGDDSPVQTDDDLF